MKWAIGATGLIILLIAFTNGIGYLGNSITDLANAGIWLIISGIVIAVTGIVEYSERR